ncbi:hypothetical protein MPDQ_007624 [Monascus purpureus]|uniref:Uncharacterized protein n=1 Tax=Monascus purpureus TaxID=5098 RepID=A0A507QV75_MONPU|nr:hypothetical protein MPDQ_007624 [Monascus purpureus]
MSPQMHSPNPGQAGAGYNSSDAWDYFHINSGDKDPRADTAPDRIWARAKGKRFETSLMLKGKVVGAGSADAISADGRVLTSTGVARVQDVVLPPSLAGLSEVGDDCEALLTVQDRRAI